MSTEYDRKPTPCDPRASNDGNRRSFLSRIGAGFGTLALHGLFCEYGYASPRPYPLSPKSPHDIGRAKSVIFCFMDGGPSHLDTFDHKPQVNRYAGRALPKSVERVVTPMGVSNNALLASKRKWKRYGESGIEVSDWYPRLGECIDDICVIRSCHADGLNHVGSVCQMNTGIIRAGRPSLGAWVCYGLGTENRNLPGFVVLLDSEKEPPGGSRIWGTGFMPATYQGTRFRNGSDPILHLHAPRFISAGRQTSKLEYINRINRRHLAARLGDTELEARIASYELAFRMQAHAPEAVDLSLETKTTRRLYGLDEKRTAAFGRNCLLARRLVERGVRFIQLYSGSGSKWDAHTRIEQNHSLHCGETDKPIAGLLTDLKQRGLLEETLVVWGGEFGRTPMSEKGDGRDHNPYGFTMWMAGGGVKGGQVIGATDDFGLRAIEDEAHVHDIHATILAAMGLDHERLIFHHQGRPERPTVNEGFVIDDVLA